MNSGIMKAIIGYGIVGVLTILYGLYIKTLLNADAEFFFYTGVAILIWGAFNILVYMYWRHQFTKYWLYKVEVETKQGKARDLTIEEEVKLEMVKKGKIFKDTSKSLVSDAKQAAKDLQF
jgi:ABC-type anion transport system duplicated permease subunit